ncbi:MAG: lysophospholipid acyltransferase family protein [Lentisphaeria bacterium]|nr:lysophospholipid acyltransferase family protein [Lentisphaeria bacterium]
MKKKTAKQRGTALSMGFFQWMITLFGLRGAYLFLHPVCLHYLLFDRQAVHSALAYIRRRFPGEGFLKQRFRVWRLFISQGRQLIDRYAALSGKVAFTYEITGAEKALAQIKAADKGIILLTSHVGNWQLAMSALGKLEKTVYLVMLPEQNEAVKRTLKMREERDRIKFISSDGHVGGVVDIMNALRQGDMVSIMGDRSEGFESMPARFLGDQASFPYGAFQIAATAGCPVLFLFASKTGLKNYHVDLSHSMTPLFTGRKDRRANLADWVQNYADILTDYCQQYPMQCFLFQDIWR